jgi:G3E family GTPase
MPVEKPLIYLVLGAAGSGRREILVDLIAGGLETTDVPMVLLPAAEAPVDADARLPNSQRWSLVEGFMVAPAPDKATHVFVVTDGRANPVDQIEAFKAWLETTGGELARVLLVVNCQLAEKTPPLLPWFEACAHFADVLLLNRREGVANKWLSDFQNRFKDQYYPFLIEFVKAGRVKNPVLVLDPLARRMSHLFDEDQEWVITSDDEGDTEEDIAEGDEEVEVTQEVDPYLERDAANRRKKILPDIVKYLPR